MPAKASYFFLAESFVVNYLLCAHNHWISVSIQNDYCETLTKTHPIYKGELPTQVNKSYAYDLVKKKNVVKTGFVGEVTLASCLGIMYTQANSGLSVWLPHPQGSVVGRPQPPHAKTQHNNMAFTLTSKEE